jgi:hypothetical protein
MKGYGQLCPVAVAAKIFARCRTGLPDGVALRRAPLQRHRGQRWVSGQLDPRNLDVSGLMGAVRLEGPRPLVHALIGWLLLSHHAHVERPAPTG